MAKTGISSALATPDKETYLESDGTLATYPQIYQPTQEQVEDAQTIENFILKHQDEIQGSMLSIGAALVEFNDRELYLATGHPSFHVWANQPMFHFSYEHATRMMRIVTDLVPILGDDTKNYPLGTLKELLPMVREGISDEAIRQAAANVRDLRVRDATKTLKELRGVASQNPPVTIRAIVSEGTEYNNLDITFFNNETGDVYTLGKVNIKKRDFAAFTNSINGTWLLEDKV